MAAVLASVAVVATTHGAAAQPLAASGGYVAVPLAATDGSVSVAASQSTGAISPVEDARRRALYENWLMSNYGTTTYLAPADYSVATYKILGGSVIAAGGVAVTWLFWGGATGLDDFLAGLGLFMGGCGLYMIVTGIISAVEAGTVQASSRLPEWDAALLVEPTGGSAVLRHRF